MCMCMCVFAKFVENNKCCELDWATSRLEIIQRNKKLLLTFCETLDGGFMLMEVSCWCVSGTQEAVTPQNIVDLVWMLSLQKHYIKPKTIEVIVTGIKEATYVFHVMQ